MFLVEARVHRAVKSDHRGMKCDVAGSPSRNFTRPHTQFISHQMNSIFSAEVQLFYCCIKTS